jgi:hypothetical protein
MKNGLVFLTGDPIMAEPKVVDQRSGKKAGDAGTLLDPRRSGQFKVIGGTPHHRVVPPVMDGDKVKTRAGEETILPGQTFAATGDEAEACRKDEGNKFQEQK